MSKDAVVVVAEETKSFAKSFTWSNVGYSVADKKTKGQKTLLHSMYGEIKAGEVVAIMGGSGAGKSTLLNTLAGRIGPGQLTGDILIDGKKRNIATWRLQCAYVEQDDVVFRNLSVYDTLMYSALLRLPSSIPKAEKVARVESVIASLGLQGCRDTWIGDADHRGISGGERKRVSIGIELVTDPQILFLDEPTSGLDAFNSLNIVSTIKQLAAKQGKIVLMTIHQPRTDILELFDKIILLSMGRCLWFGNTRDALESFENLDYPLPPKTNPSDFFMDIMTLDQRSKELRDASQARIDRFVAAYDIIRQNTFSSTNMLAPTPISTPGLKSGNSLVNRTRTEWPSSWLGEVMVLLHRNMVDLSRDKASIGTTIGQGLFLMLVLGFIYFKMTNDTGGVQSRIGLLFFLCINQTFAVVMPNISVFPLQRQIIKRERSAGSYRSSSAFVAKLISSLPLSFLGAIVLIIPMYWMVGLQPTAEKYFTFLCIILVHVNAANALGLLLGAGVPNVRVGLIIAPLVNIVFVLFGGQLVNLDKIPAFLRWLQWISIVAYSNKALTQNEFGGLVLDPCAPGRTCYATGEDVIREFSLGNPSLVGGFITACHTQWGFGKQTHWRIWQNYRHRRPDQPRPTAPPPPLSRQILAVNVANISNKRPAIRHIHPATGLGRRGIALGIPSCFGGHENGSAVGTMILAKVPNFTPECLWIVGSVYVGHSGATTNYSRREAFASIRQALDRVAPFDNNHPVLIFGDWNTDPQRLQRIVHSWGHGLTVMQFSGSQITKLSTVHGRRHSSIDHFVCNAPARALLTSPRVDRQTAVTDHFVIRTSIRAETQGQPPAPRAPTISRHHCLEATDRIATSNYWDVLADGATDNTDTDTDIHQLTSQFLESANAVADNLSLRLSPPVTRSNRRLLSGTTKRAILASNTARQAFIAAATHTNPDPVQCNTLRDEWSRLKAAATQLERVDGRKRWVKHADNLDRAVSDGRTDLVFAAARAMSGNSFRSAAVTPLYNSNGIVQYDPTSILRVMQGHYGSLAADTTGHSLDLQYWHGRQPIQVSRDTPPIRNSDILDQDFSWNQIAAALLQMSPRKAPGDDGISTAFYQAALYMPANTQEGVPPTPFARALLRVCGQVFASATIPRAWLCASIVSIDKKDGDPLNPGDKRGIALINVGLKLVCKAGFRKREECVGQVVSLVDIIQRRQNAGLNTHVLFIDIQKAFDTVPVGALLWKLQNMGFPRRTLAFLKALYTSSSARARAGSLLSDPFPVQRGVRQGCPLSGLLFNLFINDILNGVAPITVPGLSRDTNPIQGLMYADDVAVFADFEQSLLAASTAIEQWANCRVESYKYLGVLIDSKLDHSAWLKQKRSALEHTISALHPVLADHQLTVNYRSRIFSAVVMGKAYYGLELVGGNKSHLAPLHTTINKGIRLFTGQLVRSQRWFWSRRTKQLYRNRYWLTPQVRPKTVKQRHSFELMETLQTCGDSASLQKYVTRQLLDTSGFFKDPSFDQSRAHGTRYLMLARMDALWTARKAIQIGILVDTHPFLIDHCILCDQQLLSTSIAYLVVECEQVTGHRIQSGLVPAIQKSRLRLLGRSTRSGCGECIYLAPRWSHKWRSRSGPAVVGRGCGA
ncbi:hypothetical protein BASA83_002696 [Batrachochytrium salamandrivorans]|nr:hypothetical protein BASA83_002696 [Batrachochytrium salamandrivorans]